MESPKVGISACLLGEPVRFNGGHKKHQWISNQLGALVEYQSFCPEVGIGMPIPRPTLRLIASDSGIRAVDSDTQTNDVTDALAEYFATNTKTIEQLDGFILMQGSPSCGMERVKVYNEGPVPEKVGAGIFAAELMNQLPNLPVEESGRLNDSNIAERFLTRLYVYKEWRELKQNLTAKALIEFHSKHKFLIMLHDYAGYRETGKLLADLGDATKLEAIAETYITAVMISLNKSSSKGQRSNALLHLFGFIKNHLSPQEKRSILDLVERYRRSEIPYIAPLSVLRHYAQINQERDPYLWNQSVWMPYPDNLNQYKNVL